MDAITTRTSAIAKNFTEDDKGIDGTIQPPATEKYWEDVVSYFVYAYPSMILLIIGTIGNTLSFLVFNRKSMKQSVTSVYFRVLAFTDTMVLYSGGGVGFLVGAFNEDLRLYTDVTCKFFVSFVKVSCYTSCWILVLISIDRFIGVYIPHKYRQLCTKRRAVISMILLLCAMIAFVGGFWGTALALDNNHCGVHGNYLSFFGEVYQWLDLSVLNLIPSVILVSINVAIIVKLSYGSFGAGDDSNNTASNAKKNNNSLTVILLSISLVYILCTIPTSTAFLVIRTFSGPRRQAQVTLYIRSCETLYSANHASNFFLYCIHGTTFRKELKALFCKVEKTGSSASNSTNMSAYTVSQSDPKI